LRDAKGDGEYALPKELEEGENEPLDTEEGGEAEGKNCVDHCVDHGVGLSGYCTSKCECPSKI